MQRGRAPNPEGISPILLQSGFINLIIVIIIDFSQQIWGIFPIFGGYWALFEAIYLEEVGGWLPTSDLYKPGLLEAKRGDSKKVYDEDFPNQSHFYAGKLLRSTPL
jgi:hypothetical protein